MSGEITLTRTYFLARKEDLPRCYERYLDRVERVKQVTPVYLIADRECHESDATVRENLLHDLRAQSNKALDEDKWDLYSYSTVLESVYESMGPDSVTRLWEDMLLADGKEQPRPFISTVTGAFMSRPRIPSNALRFLDGLVPMETNPDKIIANILDDMAEIGDWTSIADALGANGRNSHFATRDEVKVILTALKQSPEIAVGRLANGFRDLPDDWDPGEVTDDIFSASDPIFAMMDTLMRPTGEWPERRTLTC